MAIARNPDSAAAYNQLGILYRKLGRFTDAVESYQRALEIQPDYALAHLNLGVLYDLYLQQPDKALLEFESYVSIAGDSDAVVNGWIKEIKSRLSGAARSARSEA
jgi:tetratricopeptide (TPR) repeat protein